MNLVIEGEMTNRPGLLSIGTLYTSESTSECILNPLSAREACNEILTDRKGYIMSPFYPDSYANDENCSWIIKARKGHVIRLEFKVFELELSPRCSADYVEVYDEDEAQSTSRIGRYCGRRYPQIIQSQSNMLKIVFQSSKSGKGQGFKIYYQMIEGAKDDSCIQDCPSSCNCRRLEDGGIIMASHQLQSIPKRLPKKTNAILFGGNKIYQVKSHAFIKQSYLSLIDLSYNRIFSIEEMSFVNLHSLKTLRLNRNFIKEVQKNRFSGVGGLEVIDFGQNLISSIEMETFSGFPALRALSLRSNKIKGLHKLTFQNNTNLRYL
ncbi:cubilin-like [Actinia tenebrosa]|uniref:Cubilin-like n=1 Tax=Actinia tenebrosa TaxID=6105 RepID=A0A6P8J9G3_ACTTE|nr:cubilin-like [Actinia tenebrosa]